MPEILCSGAVGKLRGIALIACIFFFTASGFGAKKPTNEDCLSCHGDATLTKDVDGKQVSLQVDPEHFKTSIHGTMFTCVDCHKGVKAEPHEKTPAKVNCGQCHADEQAAYERSYHAKAIKAGDGQAATCEDCHGSVHELLPASDAKPRQYPRHLRALPRAKVRDGGQRAERATLHLVPGERARPRGRGG
jgi:nitrate/TMAO reductase-like tetraheme cytochrome c subunit